MIMSEIDIENLSRRVFLQGSAGLTLGFCPAGDGRRTGRDAAGVRAMPASLSRTPFCASAPTTA
jgi:hypothetical protein